MKDEEKKDQEQFENKESLIHKMDDVRKELAENEDLLKDNEDLYKLLTIPNVDLTQRMKWMKNIFDGKVSDETLALMCILSEKVGMYEFYQDLQDFKKLLEDEHAISRGVIYSVEPLDDSTVSDLTAQVEKLMGKECVLVNRIDKSIMGGVLISIDGKLIDLSLRKRMEDLHVSIDEGFQGRKGK